MPNDQLPEPVLEAPEPKKTNLLKRAWHYSIHTKNGRVFVAALLIIIMAGAGTLYAISGYSVNIAENTLFKAPEPTYSPLTGSELEDPKRADRPVTAVMIENSPSARPHSGLKEAGIVYEAIAEAGITRFVALYQEDEPKLIGPVRSVRPYYVEWASAYDPAMAHVGGSARALKMIRSGNYGVDLDQFFNAGSYYRSSDRQAPHNMYTTGAKLSKLMKQKGATKSNFDGFERKTIRPVAKPNASKISIGISTGDYAVSYKYNSDTNNYTRSMGGKPHKDREKGIIRPSVVIALKVTEKTVEEDGVRENIKTTGDGKAYVFQAGTVTKVNWSRSSATAPLILKDSEGLPFSLNRGQTWITALDNSKKVSWQ